MVSAGAWLPFIYPQAGSRLVPSRQAVLYLQPPSHLAAAWAEAPVLVDQGTTHGAYILPPRGGTRLKIGDHTFSRRGNGADDRIPTAADTAGVLTAAREIFADFDQYTGLEPKVCYYTVTEDERFVVEPIGRSAWLYSACSGHGFKLGPLIASGLADAAARQPPHHQPPRLGRRPRPLTPSNCGSKFHPTPRSRRFVSPAAHSVRGKSPLVLWNNDAGIGSADMVSVAKSAGGMSGPWSQPPSNQNRPDSEAARLRPEERDAAILTGHLPFSLFDIERSSRDDLQSPLFRGGR